MAESKKRFEDYAERAGKFWGQEASYGAGQFNYGKRRIYKDPEAQPLFNLREEMRAYGMPETVQGVEKVFDEHSMPKVTFPEGPPVAGGRRQLASLGGNMTDASAQPRQYPTSNAQGKGDMGAQNVPGPMDFGYMMRALGELLSGMRPAQAAPNQMSYGPDTKTYGDQGMQIQNPAMQPPPPPMPMQNPLGSQLMNAPMAQMPMPQDVGMDPNTVQLLSMFDQGQQQGAEMATAPTPPMPAPNPARAKPKQVSKPKDKPKRNIKEGK